MCCQHLPPDQPEVPCRAARSPISTRVRCLETPVVSTSFNYLLAASGADARGPIPNRDPTGTKPAFGLRRLLAPAQGGSIPTGIPLERAYALPSRSYFRRRRSGAPFQTARALACWARSQSGIPLERRTHLGVEGRSPHFPPFPREWGGEWCSELL